MVNKEVTSKLSKQSFGSRVILEISCAKCVELSTREEELPVKGFRRWVKYLASSTRVPNAYCINRCKTLLQVRLSANISTVNGMSKRCNTNVMPDMYIYS